MYRNVQKRNGEKNERKKKEMRRDGEKEENES